MSKYCITVEGKRGRCLMLKESVKKTEIIVEEMPFAYGPKQNSGIVCLGCYCYLEFDNNAFSNSMIINPYNRCQKCGWPLCSSCTNTPDHCQNECAIFSKAKVTFAGNVGESGICTQLNCITPLRVLLKKEIDPSRWETEIQPMEYHEHSRRQLTDIWNADIINISRYLRGPCKLADRFSEDLIMQVVGILEVNAFEARTPLGYPLRCLYPITGILAHNCIPNTTRSIYPSEGYRIRLRAMCDLKPGQQLHHSYTYTLNGTAQRQDHLKSGKFFTCICERCNDPTELGTNFSTFKCSECENGWILCSNPIDEDTSWKCNNCKFNISNHAIQRAVSVMQTELESVQNIKSGSCRLEEMETLSRKYSSVVHPSHFIQISLCQNLIEMYGRVEKYELISLPDALLERKVDLCQKMLHVLNVFEPGLSRSRALTLYELHVPLVLLAKNAFIAGSLTGQALQKKLIEAVEALQECVDILQYEDKNSQEGVLYKVAYIALEQLNTSIEGLKDRIHTNIIKKTKKNLI